MAMRENRRVVNTRYVRRDDSDQIPEILTSTAVRTAAHYECLPSEARERQGLTQPSPMMQAVLELPIDEALDRRENRGLRRGIVIGALGLFVVETQLAMILHMLLNWTR